MKLVPGPRLLIWVAVVAVPLSALLGLPPPAPLVAAVLLSAFAFVTLGDAFRSLGSLDGIDVSLPEVVRLTKDRDGEIVLRLKTAPGRDRELRMALPLPVEIRARHAEMTIRVPHDQPLSVLAWPCRPLERGSYSIDRCRVEGNSPLGFWLYREARPLATEVRVYPNLWNERKTVGALFLNRGTFGIHAQRQVGKGREFEKLREYIPGDDFDDIHWKATGKRGRPVTKVYQIERTQEIYLVIDSSRLSERRLAGIRQADEEGVDVAAETVLERYVTAALIMALAAEQQGDLFGLVTYSDKVDRFVRAKSGKGHFQICRDTLHSMQPRPVTPDFAEVATFLRARLRRRALLVFLAELDDPLLAESFARHVELIARQHLVLANMLRPLGARPLFSDPGVAGIDDVYRHLGGHYMWQKLRELENVLRRRGVQFMLLENEKLSAQLVSQYLNVKRRQIL
ncbi:MAG: DUF58 domain-containing protein [Acidobacteria bacterium]|nr:DUF58 domain-containing protein [Acidobacteriota bacterium]